MLGGDKIPYVLEGYGYLYTSSSDGKLLKIKVKCCLTFPLTVVSLGRYAEQLGRGCTSFDLHYNIVGKTGYALFNYHNYNARNVSTPTIYKFCLSYIYVFKLSKNLQVNSISNIMRYTL